jgi:nicotinamide-nucleotide adenylyltransferase
MFNFSSTEYKKGNFDMVSDEIQSYIGSNFLYFSDIARFFIKSNDRYAHLKYTASMAKQIAKVTNPNDKDFIRKAYEGGYMHDITKE